VQGATRAQYWYALGVSERVLARIALDRGCKDDAATAFDRAVQTFERIGAAFEAERTRLEFATARVSG
jgi:hypothetical protein